MLGQEREKKYELTTFPFRCSSPGSQSFWIWTVRRKDGGALLASGSGNTRNAAYWTGKNWLRRYERKQAREGKR
jgi:hypothetical protein